MKIKNEIVKETGSAFNCAATVAHIGMIKLTGGIALYAARIHEMDTPPPPRQRQIRRDAIGREV